MFGQYTTSALSILNHAPLLVYIFIFIFTVLEALPIIGTVVPGHTALILCGILVSQGHLSAALLFIVAFLGSVLGDGIFYLLGRRYGASFLRKRGRMVRAALVASERVFARYSAMSIIIGRFSSITRAFVPLLAGSARLDQRKFWTADIIACALWSGSGLALGYLLGRGYNLLNHSVGLYTMIALVIAVSFAIYYNRIERLLHVHARLALFALCSSMLVIFAVLLDALEDKGERLSAVVTGIDRWAQIGADSHQSFAPFWQIAAKLAHPAVLTLVLVIAIALSHRDRDDLVFLCCGYALSLIAGLLPQALNTYPNRELLMATLVYGAAFIVLLQRNSAGDLAQHWTRHPRAAFALFAPLFVLVTAISAAARGFVISGITGAASLGVGLLAAALLTRELFAIFNRQPLNESK